MAKKNIAGVGGGLTMPTGFNAKLSAWSATYNITTEEVTGFDSGGCEEHEPVAISVSGSGTGTLQYDDSNAKPLPTALADGAVLAVGDLLTNAVGSLTLTAITGCTWAFSAVISGIAIERPAKGKATVTFNFQSTGPITQTWDETA
jgi:hypothetical protein